MSPPSHDPSQLLNLGAAFSASRVLLSAIELDLFSVLQTPITAEKLRIALNLHPRCIPDFPDTLVALGVLHREGNGPTALYGNTAETNTFLVKTSSQYIGGLLEYCASTLYHRWGHLTEALQSGEPQHQVLEERRGGGGECIWENHVAVAELFTTAMIGMNTPAHRAFAQRFDFGNCKTLLDLGGASGQLCCEVTRCNAHMTCTNFDLWIVEKFAVENVRRQGLEERVRIQNGDFLKDEFGEADVVVMSNVLHAFGKEQKKLMLKKAFDALSSGGRLVVMEMLIDDGRRSSVNALIMSLNMLIETRSGYNFSACDCDDMCREMGFARTEKMELLPPLEGVVAHKA